MTIAEKISTALAIAAASSTTLGLAIAALRQEVGR